MIKSQFDWQKRVVSVDNLKAMCCRISGVCHQFTVHCGDKSSRVIVEYSNPDEYGNPHPIRAVFPAYPGHNNSLAVVLDSLRYTGCKGVNEEAWQAFDQLYDCPLLWHDPNTGEWQTEYEILIARNPGFAVRSEWVDGGSQQIWYFQEQQFKDYRSAQAAAVAAIKSLKS